ncbi:MFS transporter [Phenylobacterium sp. LjRoot219]|uniref:MFS transporter n=1 Tax=Phenylobacterium sp. LjRoot219 TaxID=3342283 RepID=UPI003ECCD2C5
MAGILLCSVNNYSLGVMIGPLEREFGWSRAEISSGPLIISMIALVCAPLVGLVVDRLGPRPVGLFGVVFYCAALALLATTTADVTSWWGLWALIGLASMFVAPMVWTAAINSRFDKNRGMALALALCGTGVGAATVPLLTNSLVAAQGWRAAYVSLALISGAIVLPLVFFLFHNLKAAPAGARPVAAGRRSQEIRAELTSPSFLKLAGAALLFAIASCALTSNGVPILIGEGFDRTTAAGVAGLIGLGSIAGRLGGGYLLDRIDARKVAAVSVLAPVISVSLLLATDGSQPAAIAACLILGLSVGTELDACAYLAARHFGMRNFGTLFGAITGLLLFGNGLAPAAANRVYDVTRSYDLVLLAIIVLCVMAAGLFMLLGKYPEAVSAAADSAPPAAAPAPATP